MKLDEKKTKRIEELKHYEVLLGNCISYLWEVWNNYSLEEVEKSFKRLGFTDKDLEHWEIKQEIEYLKEQIKNRGGV